jgi:hypothetical protein
VRKVVHGQAVIVSERIIVHHDNNMGLLWALSTASLGRV